MREITNARQQASDRNRIPKPRTLKEVPAYLVTFVKTLFSRLGYIFKLVWDTRPALLFLMIFMSVFNGVMPVAGSLIGSEILNRLAQSRTGADLLFRSVSALLVLQFVYMFVNSAVSRIYNTISSISGEMVSHNVKMKIMKKAKEVDMVRFDSPEFYAQMENANREAGSRPIQIMSSAFSMLSSCISIGSFIALMFSVSRIAPLLIILVAIPTTAVNFTFRRKNVDYMNFRSRNRREMNYYADTVVNKDLIKEIRMFGLNDTFCDKYQNAYREYFDGVKKLKKSECFWSLAATVLNNAVYCGLYIFIAKQVFSGALEVGDFSLYTGAIHSIGNGVGGLISTTAGIYEGTLFINNLIEFLNAEPGIVPSLEEPRHVERHTGHTVEFRDVSFRYPGSDREVLRHVSFRIEAGETVVIVGLNGAGKTTLVKLLTRLYDPTGGVILLDGHDIREYDVDELYAMFGIIFQDFGKYAASAAENIVYGDITRGSDPALIREAASLSGVDAYLESLPQGYETPLMRYFDPSGSDLSIGQWQKLAIARAFYSDSDILILDEPTASLDPIAEQEIFRRFDELREDKTSLFISHRLSSATIADKILVMENGELIEEGDHRSLMERGGRYCDLFTIQAARYVGDTN